MDARRYFHRKIVRGFEAFLKQRSLGESQLSDARKYSREYDEKQ